MTLAPGVELVSDPFELTVPGLAHLAISLFVEGESGLPAWHMASEVTENYITTAEGDFTAATVLEDATDSRLYYWLSAIDVAAPADAFTVVTMGDSITDGAGGGQDWPSMLSVRFQNDERTRHIAVANVGKSANRLLSDGNAIGGVSGMARFETDVLAQPNARWLMLLEGINDIGGGAGREPPLSAQDLIAGYRQIIDKAHTHGIRVVGCTILPYKGAFYYDEAMDEVRREVNRWIRTSGAFDAVVDFEDAVEDPEDPLRIREDLHRGDFLHPSTKGYQFMADAVDLTIFTR